MRLSNNPVVSLLIKKKYFFIPYCLFFIFCTILLIILKKGEDVIAVNSIHNGVLDYSAEYLTYLGDGIAVMIFALLFFIFSKVKYSFYIVQSFLLSGLISQIIKHIYDIPRPKAFFAHSNILLHYVNGVSVYSHHSFPSGHTATIFSFMLLLSFITNNKYMSGIYFISALIIAMTRIYLAQHFLLDVYVASFIGIISTVSVYTFWEFHFKNHHTYWQEKQIFAKQLSFISSLFSSH